VQDAADRSRTAAAVAERLGTEAGEIYRLAQQVVLCRDVGGLGALVDPLQAVADRYPALVTLQMLLTVVQAELGQADDAAAGLARLAADEFAAVPPDSLWTATLCYAVEMAALLGDGRTAALAGRLVEPYRGTCAVQGVPVAWGAVDRAVGLARLASGDRTGGLAALEAALDLHRRWGCTALAVRTRLDLAAARGMDAEGRRHAQLARADAERLGLTRLVERATGLLDAAPVRLSGPGGTLSARETEVLDLLARGVSNQGIAARLVLSVNTVERHVRNLYLKLGVANRAEAAALAARSAAPGPPADHGFR
jgi:ATP/maltotriose-dependent transcriptional regulator MalT